MASRVSPVRRASDAPTRSVAAGLRSRSAGALTVLAAAAILVAGCGDPGTEIPATPATVAPAARTPGPEVLLTRGDLARALGERRLQLVDAAVPFRPAEAPTLAAAPRAVYQVVLPEEPAAGFIIVYDLPAPQAATAAAQEQASYLASGPGRVQAPLSTEYVLRVVGSTVVVYGWIPDEARDPGAPEIAAALETVGLGIPVPS